MPKNLCTQEGDVFNIELKERLFAFGQIVAKKRTAATSVASVTFITFEYVSDIPAPDVNMIVQKPIVFFLHAIDIEVTDGKWKVIGNKPPPPTIRFPEYKVDTVRGFKVMSHKGEILRDATEEERRTLGRLKYYDPRMLEKALKAKAGLMEWLPWMDELVYENVKGWVPYKASPPGQGADPADSEQAVIVHFNYGSLDFAPLKKLEKELDETASKTGTGDYDGDEIAVDGSDGFLYLYGPDADRLFKAIEPILKRAKFMKGAQVTLRYGPPTEGVRRKVGFI